MRLGTIHSRVNRIASYWKRLPGLPIMIAIFSGFIFADVMIIKSIRFA